VCSTGLHGWDSCRFPPSWTDFLIPLELRKMRGGVVGGETQAELPASEDCPVGQGVHAVRTAVVPAKVLTGHATHPRGRLNQPGLHWGRVAGAGVGSLVSVTGGGEGGGACEGCPVSRGHPSRLGTNSPFSMIVLLQQSIPIPVQREQADPNWHALCAEHMFMLVCLPLTVFRP